MTGQRRAPRGGSWLVVAVALLLFTPLIVEGTTFYPFDIVEDYLPWAQGQRAHNPLLTDPVNAMLPGSFYAVHRFTADVFESTGTWPLWNPRIFGGIPHERYYQTPVAPALFALLPTTWAHDLLLLAGVLAAGALQLVWLRRRTTSEVAAAFGAVAWMLNGTLCTFFEFEHITTLMAATPALFLGVEDTARPRTRVRGVVLTAFAALTAVGMCHPQQALYLLIAGAVVAVTVLAHTAQGVRGTTLRAMVVAVVLFLVGAAGVFMLGMSAVADTNRVAMTYDELRATTGTLPLAWLAT